MTDAPRRHTHLGVYAVIRNDPDAAVLLIQKARGPYKGSWDLPGGRIEFGESPEQALRREAIEETGLSLEGDLHLLTALSHHVLWHPEPDVAEDLHHLGLLYSAAHTTGTLKETGDSEDACGAAWIPMETLPTLSLTPFAQVVRQLLQCPIS